MAIEYSSRAQYRAQYTTSVPSTLQYSSPEHAFSTKSYALGQYRTSHSAHIGAYTFAAVFVNAVLIRPGTQNARLRTRIRAGRSRMPVPVRHSTRIHVGQYDTSSADTRRAIPNCRCSPT
eukprot:1659091-Rhodomonas_salina.1